MFEKAYFRIFLVTNRLLSTVPATPEIQVSECQVCDNTVTVIWALPEPDSKIDHYILEHRRTNHEGPPRIREDYPWMVVEGIRELEHTLTGRRATVWRCLLSGLEESVNKEILYVFVFEGLRFDTRYITFRVKACNKAVAGEFSEPITLETHGEKATQTNSFAGVVTDASL